MHGNERRADRPIDVSDDRSADGGCRDIQVILIESATINSNQLKIGFNSDIEHSVIVVRVIRDIVIGHDATRRNRSIERLGQSMRKKKTKSAILSRE